MSTTIKSDSASGNSFGYVKSINADPSELFNDYKSRVQADGGTITDEATTLAIFRKLVDIAAYGIFNTFVSAKFGVKLDSNGGITKLYSLDGSDLVAKVFGSGQLPIIQDGGVKFRNRETDAVNGVILTTEKPKILAPNGITGIGWRNLINSVGMNFAYSSHTAGNGMQFLLSLNYSGRDMNLYTRGGTDLLIGQANNPPTLVEVDITTPATNTHRFFRSGVRVPVATQKGNITKEISDSPLYIDIGGRYEADNHKYFSAANISYFYSTRGFSEAQALALSNITI